MVNFTLKQIRYFEAVAKYGGLAQAAREINISQPAIAQAMDKLEDNCGFQIFIRHHAKGFELTTKGRAVLFEMQKTLRQAEKTFDAIENIRNDISGVLRIGCFQSIAPFYLATIMQEYQEIYPNIKFDIQELLQGDLIRGLHHKELDLVIMYDLGVSHPDIEFHHLSSAEPYVILSDDHKFSNEKSISLKDLKDERYVLFDAPGSREYFHGLFKQIGIKPEISFYSTSLESVRSAVGNCLGFSILSMRPPSTKCYDGSKVAVLSIKDKIDHTKIVMAHRADFKLEQLHQEFMKFCQDKFLELSSAFSG